MTIKIRIQPYADRQKIVEGLTNNGYKTWVEREEKQCSLSSGDFYVCFELINRTDLEPKETRVKDAK